MPTQAPPHIFVFGSNPHFNGRGFPMFRWLSCWAVARPVKAVSIMSARANLSHSLMFILLTSFCYLTRARGLKAVELFSARKKFFASLLIMRFNHNDGQAFS